MRNVIMCPRTGRVWPAEKSVDLRDCILCGGKIDIRHETWKGTSNGKQPQHVVCPPQSARTTQVVTPNPVSSGPLKPTGKELIAEWDKQRDKVHEEATKVADKRNKHGCYKDHAHSSLDPECEWYDPPQEEE